MPVPFNPQSVIIFASTVSPIFISFYLILEGAFNGNVRFIVWLVGLFIAIMIGILLRGPGTMQLEGSTPAEKTAELENYVKKCMTFDGPFNGAFAKRSGPSSHSIFHSFTIAYILSGILSNPNDVGWPFIILLIIIASIDLAIRQKNRCNTFTDTIKGGALGTFVGILWFQLIKNTSWPGEQMLYFGKEEGGKKCKLDKSRHFRCRKTKMQYAGESATKERLVIKPHGAQDHQVTLEHTNDAEHKKN